MNQEIDIKTLRKSHGLTQTEFGDAIGVDQSTVSPWERNGPPKKGPARKLLDAMSQTYSNDEQPLRADALREVSR
jgi:DNA-binding transcriptional regulator YiaG